MSYPDSRTAPHPTEGPLDPKPKSRVPGGYDAHGGDRQFATTLARGLALLRCFAPGETVLGNKDLSQRLGLPRATVSRLAYTLMAMGYLVQDAESGKFRLGAAVLTLGYPLLEMFSFRQRARAGMLDLAERYRCTVAIAVRDRTDMVCIEVIRRGVRLGHPIDIGRTYSLVGTAVGRAYLAGCDPAERERLLNQVRVHAPDEWQRHAGQLQRNLTDYPGRGCCTSVGEVLADVQAVAVPLGRIDRGELAALNCSFQRSKLDEHHLVDKVAPDLIALARALV